MKTTAAAKKTRTHSPCVLNGNTDSQHDRPDARRCGAAGRVRVSRWSATVARLVSNCLVSACVRRPRYPLGKARCTHPNFPVQLIFTCLHSHVFRVFCRRNLRTAMKAGLLLLAPFVLVGTAAAADATCTDATFPPAAQFERWSHFKWAVPKITGDALNQAAVATGSCWLLNKPFDAFFFWRRPQETASVLDALANVFSSNDQMLGSTSNFTLTAAEALSAPCEVAGLLDSPMPTPVPSNFTIAALTAAAQNWYHALCAPSSDPSWPNGFDPAYQPQQMALTAGLLCLATCDVSDKSFPQESISAVLTAPKLARDSVCAAFPWGPSSATTFINHTTRDELASKLRPIAGTPCQCGGPRKKDTPQLDVALIIGYACLLLLLVVLALCACRQARRKALNKPLHLGTSLLVDTPLSASLSVNQPVREID